MFTVSHVTYWLELFFFLKGTGLNFNYCKMPTISQLREENNNNNFLKPLKKDVGLQLGYVSLGLG